MGDLWSNAYRTMFEQARNKRKERRELLTEDEIGTYTAQLQELRNQAGDISQRISDLEYLLGLK